MRRIAVLLGTTALFSLGAVTPTACQSLLWALMGDSIIPPLTISVHVINDAAGPVSVNLSTGATPDTDDIDDLIDSLTEEVAAAEATGGTSLERGEEYSTTFLCAAAPESLSVEATIDGPAGEETDEEEGEDGPTAVSPTLRYGIDFECGDRVNFIVRSAARVGVVVGYDVEEGGADLVAP